jgi:hypothetical protein
MEKELAMKYLQGSISNNYWLKAFVALAAFVLSIVALISSALEFYHYVIGESTHPVAKIVQVIGFPTYPDYKNVDWFNHILVSAFGAATALLFYIGLAAIIALGLNGLLRYLTLTKDEYDEYKKEAQAAQVIPHINRGKLVSISVSGGGLFSSSITSVVTDQAAFSIYGTTKPLNIGGNVIQVGNCLSLPLIDGGAKRYDLART